MQVEPARRLDVELASHSENLGDMSQNAMRFGIRARLMGRDRRSVRPEASGDFLEGPGPT